MPLETMIECEKLTRRFGHFSAVDHVSFPVAMGSIFGFLGSNGASPLRCLGCGFSWAKVPFCPVLTGFVYA